MVTNKVIVDGSGSGFDEALDLTDGFISQTGMDHKTGMHLHLLAEETMGMVTAIAEEFSALFWLESTDDSVRIHLLAHTDMDMDKKRALIETSKNKRNDAAVSVLGKIREIVENGMYKMDEVGKLQAQYGGVSLMYSMMGSVDATYAQAVDYQWSLEKYRDNVDEARDEDPAAKAAWDELEKSILGNFADDVRVAVKGDSVEVVIEKKM